MSLRILRAGRSLPLTATVLLITPAAWAHHSFVAEYDTKQTLTSHGTVKDFEWTNPHSAVDVVTDDQVLLGLQLNGPTGLMPAGWKPTTLKPGDKITVVYHPLRRREPWEVFGQLVKLQMADGTWLRGGGLETDGSLKPQGPRLIPGRDLILPSLLKVFSCPETG
jgi:hypothetical protein